MVPVPIKPTERSRVYAAVAALGLFLTARGASAMPPWGTGESRGEDLVISLITFGPGDAIISWFGHSALAVEDRRLGQGRLYNYGMFTFDETMLARFAMGRLTFWVGEDSIPGTLELYRREGRDVRVQELNLSPAKRLEMARALAENVLPGNREYLYHHYNDNCATRPRDAIDRAVGGQLRKGTSGPARLSLREHTRRHSAVLPPMSVLLDFLMNDEIDRPITRWDEAFLPEELEAQVASTVYVDEAGESKALVARAAQVHLSSREPVPGKPPSYAGWLLALGLVLGGIPVALALGRSRSRGRRVLLGVFHSAVGLVFGLPGLVLCLMWLITEHTVTWWNENLLLANPLTFLALPFGLALIFGARWAPKALSWVWLALAAIGTLAVVLKALPAFDQDNWRLIGLLLPVNLGAAAGLWLAELAGRLKGGGAMLLTGERHGR